MLIEAIGVAPSPMKNSITPSQWSDAPELQRARGFILIALTPSNY